jgi:hypothetical protein
MTPLARLYGHQRLEGDDLLIAEMMPLMHKRLLEEGKAGEPIIDVLFELAIRLQIIGDVAKNAPIKKLGEDCALALQKACDIANQQGKYIIEPSTDQMRVICRALEALAKLAHTVTKKTHLMAVFAAAELYGQIKRGAAA